MVQRRIVEIDEDKCDGCGLCIPACHEGAIEIVNGKARLVDDKFCDGIGDCLGECPRDAIKIIERDAEKYDEEAVQRKMYEMDRKQTNKSTCNKENHSHHSGCPGTRMMDLSVEESIKNENKEEGRKTTINNSDIEIKIKSQLQQWPVQLMLIPEKAPYFDGAELLLTADCVSIAYPDYHLDLLKGKAVAMGCPKLDDNQHYMQKLSSIINKNNIKGVTVAFMEVPCCSGLVRAAETAIMESNKDVTLTKIKIGIKGTKELL